MALALSASLPAMAQTEADKTTARNLFFEARDAYTAGNFGEAAELFGRSNAIYPAPTAALGMARALRDSGSLVESFEAYTAIVNAGVADDAPDAFKSAVESAETERTAVEPRLPSVIIRIDCACEPAVSLDDKAVPSAALGVKRYVNPGTRRIEASAEGHTTAAKEVSVQEGTTVEVQLALEPNAETPPPIPAPPPVPAPSPGPLDTGLPSGPDPEPTNVEGTDDGSGMRTAAIVVGSVGVASLLVAGITGGLYFSKASTVDDKCSANPNGEGRICSDQAAIDAASAGNTLALVNTITLPIGAVALGTGLILYLLAPSSNEVAVVPSFGPQHAGLTVMGGF
jgi:PEGA domain